MLLEPVDPFRDCLTGYAEAFGEFADGIIVQLIVFEKSLSLFAHGNIFPGHGHHLLSKVGIPMSSEFVLPTSQNGSIIGHMDA